MLKILKALALQSYLLTAFLLLFGQSAHGVLSCQEILQLQPISLGDQVDIRVKIKTMNRSYKGVIFIGESTHPHSDTKVLIFSDAKRNIYYFDTAAVLINGNSAVDYDFSTEQLPRILKQTQGSCNLCANVSAVNQLALDNSVDPISLSVFEIEHSKTADIFSWEASFRLLLNTLYDIIWPEGYIIGAIGEIQEPALRKPLYEFMTRNMNALTRSLEFTDLDLGPEYIELPLRVQSKHTYESDEFLEHLRSGGTAVVGGIVVMDEVTVSRDMSGQSRLFQVPRLTPFEADEANKEEFEEDPVGQIINNPGFKIILEKLKKGEKPNRRFILDSIKLFLKKPGHAVAAIRLIEEGPLEGFIVIINSWGTFEIHPPSDFVDDLNYVLVSGL